MDIGTGMMNIAAGYREGQLEGRINQLVADSHKWARHCNKLKDRVDTEVAVKLLMTARVYCWQDFARELAAQHPVYKDAQKRAEYLNQRLAVHASNVFEEAGYDLPEFDVIRFK